MHEFVRSNTQMIAFCAGQLFSLGVGIWLGRLTRKEK